MPITEAHLLRIYPNASQRAGVFVPALNRAMERYQINTPARQAAFLAQIGHESGQLKWVKELWGPTQAQQKYEGRKALGNTESGDGRRFLGRGLLQVTGRENYRKTGAALGVPLLDKPELLELPEWAAASAAWWWTNHGLNELADVGQFEQITRVINGGLNGQRERLELWARAKEVLA